MKHLLSLSLLFIFFSNSAKAQKPYAWAKSSSGSGYESAWNVHVSKQGHVFHIGKFTDVADFDPGPGTANLTSHGLEDIYFAKYDSAGNYLWARSIGGTQNDEGYQIVTDDTGNVYIMGIIRDFVDLDPGVGIDTVTAGFMDVFVAKFDSAGNHIWAKHMGTGSIHCYNMKVDKAGNIYLAGGLYNSFDFDPGIGTAVLSSSGANLFFAKYDNSCNYIRATEIGDNNQQSISLGDMIIDEQGNMYITGSFSSSGPFDFDPGLGYGGLYSYNLNGFDVYVAKYDSAGNYLWAMSMVDSTTNDEHGMGIALGTDGDIYICGRLGQMGSTTGSPDADFDPGPGVINLATGPGAFFARYDSAGHYVYAKALYSNSAQLNPISITVDGADNVYLAGTFLDNVDFDPGVGVYNHSGLNNNIFLAGYDGNGQLDFAYAFGGVNNCGVKDVVLDTLHNVYIAGSYSGTIDFDPGTNVANLTALGGQDMLVAKYGDSVAPVKVNTPDKHEDISIYPNPAKETITVKSGSKVSEIRLTNVMGQLLQTTQESTINLRDHAPGVYFLQVSTADGNFTKKFLKE